METIKARFARNFIAGDTIWAIYDVEGADYPALVIDYDCMSQGSPVISLLPAEKNESTCSGFITVGQPLLTGYGDLGVSPQQVLNAYARKEGINIEIE